MNMIQVAHCLRVSGDLAKLVNPKLTARDKATLKREMDRAFTDGGPLNG